MSSNTAAKTPANTTTKTRMMVQIAMLTAVAEVLMLFDFPLPFAPSFYKIDLSEVPILIGCFAMGPAAGIIIEAMKILLNHQRNRDRRRWRAGQFCHRLFHGASRRPDLSLSQDQKKCSPRNGSRNPGYGSHRRPFKCFRSSSRLCGSLRRNGCHHRNGNCRQ